MRELHLARVLAGAARRRVEPAQRRGREGDVGVDVEGAGEHRRLVAHHADATTADMGEADDDVGRPRRLELEELAVVDARDWRTNKARDAAGAARAEGKVPLLTAEHEQVQAMAKAISEHPLASALLCHGDVEPEQSMFWPDPVFGIWRRARLDAARQPGSGRLIITDYKTVASAEPGKFAKAVYDYRYHMQAAWYLDAAAACLGEHDAAFLFVAQEKAAPYLTGVYGLDQDSLDLGRAMNERAMERYRDCTESGIWPGYQPEGVGYLSLPPWAYTREDYL